MDGTRTERVDGVVDSVGKSIRQRTGRAHQCSCLLLLVLSPVARQGLPAGAQFSEENESRSAEQDEHRHEAIKHAVRKLGRSHDALWHDTWLPNERDFEQRFTPRDAAHLLYAPSH